MISIKSLVSKNKKMINFKVKIPPKASNSKIENFFIKKGLKEMINLSKAKSKGVNDMIHLSPYKPELKDLYNLYNYITLNKRITILEFGSGWSSLIMAMALNELKKIF